MGKVFFISDTHFGHAAIMRYESRPFDSPEEMDEAIIANWNGAVAPEDTVWVLGDFSLRPFEETKAILNRLNGTKYLVLGNQDRGQPPGYYRDAGFQEAYDLPVVYAGTFILSHEPLYVNANMPYVNLFGHVHGCKEYTDFSEQSFCLCCERIGYTPISFEAIKAKIGK